MANKKKVKIVLFILLLCACIFFYFKNDANIDEPIINNIDDNRITYHFRNDELLNSHYEKHGIDMGFDNAQDYESAANEVIYNEDALHKLEKEDNDDVYFVEDTNEFVVLSTDGYIRTYFLASKNYFDKQ
jgi:pyocin large subunit-like protein